MAPQHDKPLAGTKAPRCPASVALAGTACAVVPMLSRTFGNNRPLKASTGGESIPPDSSPKYWRGVNTP
jgi:hypothetical protein